MTDDYSFVAVQYNCALRSIER